MGLKKTAAEQRCDEIVAFISDYVLRNGYSPTFREVGEAVGLHSPSSISKYLHRLAEEGRVFFDESRPRTISTVDRRDDIETYLFGNGRRRQTIHGLPSAKAQGSAGQRVL